MTTLKEVTAKSEKALANVAKFEAGSITFAQLSARVKFLEFKEDENFAQLINDWVISESAILKEDAAINAKITDKAWGVFESKLNAYSKHLKTHRMDLFFIAQRYMSDSATDKDMDYINLMESVDSRLISEAFLSSVLKNDTYHKLLESVYCGKIAIAYDTETSDYSHTFTYNFVGTVKAAWSLFCKDGGNFDNLILKAENAVKKATKELETKKAEILACVKFDQAKGENLSDKMNDYSDTLMNDVSIMSDKSAAEYIGASSRLDSYTSLESEYLAILGDIEKGQYKVSTLADRKAKTRI